MSVSRMSKGRKYLIRLIAPILEAIFLEMTLPRKIIQLWDTFLALTVFA